MTVLDKIVESFNAAPTSLPVRRSYDENVFEMNDEKIEAILAKQSNSDQVVRYISQGRDVNPFLSPFSNDTSGEIEHGRLFMWTITRDPRTAVEKFLEWLKLVYVTKLGNLGPPQKVFDFNLVRFWRFHPAGGIQRASQKFGGKFRAVVQPIEFAAKIL